MHCINRGQQYSVYASGTPIPPSPTYNKSSTTIMAMKTFIYAVPFEEIRVLFSALYTMRRDKNAHQNHTFLGHSGDFLAMKHDVVMICQRLLILAQ